MGARRISFAMEERNHPLDAARLDSLLALVLERPFGEWDRMCLDLDEHSAEFAAFEESALVEHLKAHETSMAFMRAGERDDSHEGECEIVIARSPDENVFLVTVDQDDFVERGGVERLHAMVRRAVGAFPRLDLGAAGAAIDYPDYYDELGLDVVGRCFQLYLRWIHVMGPSGYEPYYSREDLLGCPAHRIEEWDHDVLMIMNYEDPFDYDTPETRQRLREMTEYLEARLRLPER